MQIEVFWDTQVRGNHGWLFDFPGLGPVAPGPYQKRLTKGASDKALASAVSQAAKWWGVKLPSEYELSIRREW